jgi:hypothetical protein
MGKAVWKILDNYHIVPTRLFHVGDSSTYPFLIPVFSRCSPHSITGMSRAPIASFLFFSTFPQLLLL